MAVITAAGINAILDHSVQLYARIIGTQASGQGAGVAGQAWGAAQSAGSISTALLALTDLDPVADLVKPVGELLKTVDGAGIAANHLAPLLSSLQRHVIRFGIPDVNNLDLFLRYLNTGTVTKWTGLQHPLWRDLALRWNPNITPEPCNLYFEVLQGATYANALARLTIGSAMVPGHSIAAEYAGGFGQLRVSGLSGSGVVTVTGTAFDPATRSTVAARTWTATVNANGVVALAPGGGSAAPADSLIKSVSAISAAVGISAGVIYVEAARPAGRPLLP